MTACIDNSSAACNMNINLKLIMIVLNLIFLIACVVHVSVNGYYILHPQLPSLRFLKKSLHDLDFPLAFKLCVSEINKSSDRYKRVGYSDNNDFFKGRSMFNSSLYGWCGHTVNGSIIASVQGKLSLISKETRLKSWRLRKLLDLS